MGNEGHFPNTRFPAIKDPGNDLALVDNLGLVFERIAGMAALLQHADNADESAIHNAGFMFEHEVNDAQMLLKAWHEAKRKNKGGSTEANSAA